MSANRLWFGLVLWGLIGFFHLNAQGAENVLPNGDFDRTSDEGLPAEWHCHPGQKQRISVMEEGGVTFVRLINEKKGGVGLKQLLPLKPAWRKLRISARMRARDLNVGVKSWHNARVQLTWQDARGERTGDWPRSPHLRQDTQWAEITTDERIPVDAARLALEVAMWETSGTFDVDYVRVQVTSLGGRDVADLPEGERLWWGEEAAVDLNEKRSEIVLNGIWKFVPARGPAETDPTAGWGYIRVPGTWTRSWRLPGIVSAGGGGPWQALNRDELAKAWYERRFRLPRSWAGRTVLLDLQRVSTDAAVYVNGMECGRIGWPTGRVDITRAVKLGEENLLRILVVATPDEGDVMVIMGPNQISTKKASLATRGITGDVTLVSRPKGAHVSDVFVKTSTRTRELALEVELSDVDRHGEATFAARIHGADGAVERTFTSTARVSARQTQLVRLSWPWPDPRLWDFLQPNLYTLQLEVTGPGISDAYPQTFGFREFWIEGRKFFLNGTEFRMRPCHGETYHGNNEIVAEAVIDGRIKAGFNIQEFWPGNHDERGSGAHERELWARVADRKGWPLIGCAMYMSHLAGAPWRRPGLKERWRERMEAELRRYRNHPSILMWAHSGNRFGHRDDQNPLRIGQRSWDDLPEDWKARARTGEEATALIKRADPTRPAMSHQCGPVGDVYSLNNYLCIIPLQEREEWLSRWAETGDMPYLAVEFGTPLDSTLSRSRHGGRRAGIDEPLPTEFCAIYLGERSFARASLGLRANIRAIEDDILKHRRAGEPRKGAWHWNYRMMRKNGEVIRAFQDVQELFITNTWRSWRTMGITGGMVPWAIERLGWRDFVSKPDWQKDEDRPEVGLPPFRPGMRGTYYPRIHKKWYHHLQPEGHAEVLPAGRAIMNANRDTLAWVAGPREAWVAKDHHFYERERIEKQVVLTNDSRTPQEFSYTVAVEVGGRLSERFSKRGTLDVSETRFVPFAFAAPRVRERTSGVMSLRAKIGRQTHEHDFTFRIYPHQRGGAEPASVLAFDPGGDTSEVLRAQGVALESWGGAPEAGRVLVIGRRALSGGEQRPGDLGRFVSEGGRLVIHAQDPEWMRRELGLRVSAHVGRRAWPVSTQRDHPVVAGLDGEDFRDWRGAGTLVRERCELRDVSRAGDLKYAYGDGWHWGNRGSVSSCIVEKPHHTGWTPILEQEFDLAFTSLMELRYGRGLVILSTLDVEGRQGREPMADLITRRVLKYAAEATIRPRARRTVYVGGPDGRALLDGMGVRFSSVKAADAFHAADGGRTRIPGGAELVVIGERAALDSGDLERFVDGGGSAVFLSPWPEPLPFGLTAEQARGRYAPFPEADAASGLSVGEAHTRYDIDGRTVAESPGARGVKRFGDGLLALLERGHGRAWFVGIAPGRLTSGEREYLRYSTWRLTRGIAQVLANCGAEFAADGKIFLSGRSDLAPLPLAGTWMSRVERSLPSAPNEREAHADGGNRGEAGGWHRREVDPAAWHPAEVPGAWEDSDSAHFDGAVWFRKTVELPTGWAGKELVLELGPVDDFDVTYVNGREVGRTGAGTPRHWEHRRRYRVPGSLVTDRRCLIAVRVWDHFGGGGLCAEDAAEMRIYPAGAPEKRLGLAGPWRYRVERRLPPARSLGQIHKDPGIAPRARGWMLPRVDDGSWGRMVLPQPFEKGVASFDGAVWYRTEVNIPAAYLAKNLVLELGPIDDFDVTYFNGQRVGGLDRRGRDNGSVRTPEARTVARRYPIPAHLVRPGERNVIAVRVFDTHGKGGFVGQAKQMRLLVQGIPESATWYVPGYRDDQTRGDSYTRYYRW